MFQARAMDEEEAQREDCCGTRICIAWPFTHREVFQSRQGNSQSFHILVYESRPARGSSY